MSYFGQRDFALEVALGNVSGYSTVNKFGRTPDADSGVDTDIWDGADGSTSTDVWAAPSAAKVHTIVSTSANDVGASSGVPAGTGARTIRVIGLPDWDTAETSEDVVLNGTTPINTSGSYVIIHRMYCLTFGSGGTNAGDITATATDDLSITAMITTGFGQTLMAIYGVPSTQSIALKRIWAGTLRAVSGIASDAKLLVREDADQSDSGFITKLASEFTNTSPLAHYQEIPSVFSGPCIVKMQVNTDTINSVVTGGFDGYVVDNTS